MSATSGRPQDTYRNTDKHIDEQDISISLIDMVLAADHGVRTYSRVPPIANEGLIAAVLPALEVLASHQQWQSQVAHTGASVLFDHPAICSHQAARDTMSSQDIARQLLEFGEGRLKKQPEEKSRASVDNGQEDSDKALVKPSTKSNTSATKVATRKPAAGSHRQSAGGAEPSSLPKRWLH